jgi:hypothetical protein
MIASHLDSRSAMRNATHAAPTKETDMSDKPENKGTPAFEHKNLNPKAPDHRRYWRWRLSPAEGATPGND